MLKCKSLWHVDPTHSEIRVEDLDPVQKRAVVVESAFSLISKGTESIVSKGKVPVEMFELMTVPYMSGSFSMPAKYGYSLVGKIISDGIHKNKWVHLMHPHQSHCIVKEEDLFFLSKDISPRRAVLLSNMETVINAIWDGGVKAGQKLLICGFGNIGALLALTIRKLYEAEIVIHDPIKYKQTQIKNLGFSCMESKSDRISSFDLAFNCSASGAGLQTAIDAVGLEAKIIETSWYGMEGISLHLGGSFHYMRKRIISSQVSHIPLKMRDRWDKAKRKAFAQEILEDPVFDLILDQEITLLEAPEYFRKLRLEQSEPCISTIIKYNVNNV